MDIILIPGLWLDGSSWDEVLPVLEEDGHRTHPLTLPGMRSKDDDRSQIGLRDHVAAVVAAIDAVAGPVALVAHSAGGALAHAAVDARPDRVARVVYVGGFPIGSGDAVAEGFPAENGEVPLPDWSQFDEADLVDLDDQTLAGMRERAIPVPEGVTREPQRLSDERRYDVPVTAVCTEYSSEMLKGWIDQGMAPVREFARIRGVDYVDLPTGHWPQFTRPEALAQVILRALPTGVAEFHEGAGDDWRLVGDGACAYFPTDSFAAGTRLVQALSDVAAIDHIDVDLRPEGVTVRLLTRMADRHGPSRFDVYLARRISAVAADLGLTAEPATVQAVMLTIDAMVSADVMPFWRAVLGYEYRSDSPDEDLVDPGRRGPSIWFQDMDAPRPQRNRIHIDVWVPPEVAEGRVAAALAAGGRLVRDRAPTWWTLADAEGNEVDVATVAGRD